MASQKKFSCPSQMHLRLVLNATLFIGAAACGLVLVFVSPLPLEVLDGEAFALERLAN